MTIGDGFRDDLGFVRRTGVTRQFYDAAFMPQPESLRRRGIRQLQPHARVWIYHDPAGDAGQPARPHRQADHVEQRRLRRIRLRAARGGDHPAVRHLSRRRDSDRDATTGTSTCWCSKAITAARCLDRSAPPLATSGAARSARADQRALSARPIRLVFDLGCR